MESSNANSNEPHEQHTPTSIVCLYATRDEPMYRELKAHLVLWQTKGHIRWLELTAGADVEQTLLAFIQEADCVLLLISSSFFATSICHKAMENALAEQVKRNVLVVPVLARVFDWKESDCGHLKALPDNELPVAEWEHQERAYENIRAGLARLLPGLSPASGSQSVRPRLFQARDLPRGYVPRTQVFNDIKNKLLAVREGQTTAISTALRGAGGFGKTMLALALCHDSEIQTAFPDGILWVELGEQPPRALEVLNGLLASLEPSLSGAITLDEARARWRTALDQRGCLLVIDDAWQAAALVPLLESGPRCTRLVTTRNDLVLPADTARVWVDAMEPDEAVTVLCQALSEEIHQATYQPKLEALVRQLGCWPLLLTLANGMLTDLVNYGQEIAEALTIVEQAYEAQGVTAFQLDNVEERQRTGDACLEVSIRHLEKFTHLRYHATERYQELVVFPEDTDIPLAILQIYWKGTAGLEPWETTDLCIRLHRLSLLQICDLGKGIMRLHDVLRSYLEQRAGSHLSTLHSRLLSTVWQGLGLKRWAELPKSDFYLWQHLVWHLCGAGRRAELASTLTDLSYLTHKALYVGVAALESDLLLATMREKAGATDETSMLLAPLYRTVARISHLLRQVSTKSEMGGLLLSHLGGHPSFATQRSAFESELARPFVTAWHPFPQFTSPALIRTLYGHTGLVRSCAFSPDGNSILSASNDMTLKVWDAASGAERFSLCGHTDYVFGCTYSPDGHSILSASADKTLKVWDATNGAELMTLYGHADRVRSCAFSPNGHSIVSASADGTLKVWDATSGAKRLTLHGHTDTVLSCVYSPDGRSILSASADKTLKIWDATTGVERLTLRGHTGSVNGCVYSPDGHSIVSASDDDTLKVWDAATGAERLTLRGHNVRVICCAFSPDGHSIVSGDSNPNTLKVWDAATGVERLTLRGHADTVYSCVFSPDGRSVLSASADWTLKVWDVASRDEHPSPQEYRFSVNSFAFSPDGHSIVSASDDGRLKVWDAATGAERLSLRDSRYRVIGCAFSPNGRSLLSAPVYGDLIVWDAARGDKRLVIRGHSNIVNSCTFSPDGRSILSASDDRTLKVWDATKGKERLALYGHTGSVNGCAFSPDGRSIVSASDDDTLKVWDATKGAERLTLYGHTGSVNGCAFSPDGRSIVSASDDRTLKMWDAAKGVERLTLRGHSQSVNDCAFSPDGHSIVSASADGMLKVWDAASGRCLLTFPVDGVLYCCAFHPDGQHVVACGTQGMYFLRLVM